MRSIQRNNFWHDFIFILPRKLATIFSPSRERWTDWTEKRERERERERKRDFKALLLMDTGLKYGEVKSRPLFNQFGWLICIIRERQTKICFSGTFVNKI